MTIAAEIDKRRLEDVPHVAHEGDVLMAKGISDTIFMIDRMFNILNRHSHTLGSTFLSHFVYIPRFCKLNKNHFQMKMYLVTEHK